MTVHRVHQALARLRAAWPLLHDLRDAATARRRPEPRTMGRATQASLDTLLRLEREERAGRQARLSAPSPAPADLDVIEAEQHATIVLRDLCWLSANMLRGPWLPGPGWWTMPHPWTVSRALYALHHAAPWWPAALAVDAAYDLGQAATGLEQAVQLDRRDDELRIAGETWVTTARGAERLGVSVDNVRDWDRRRLVVDQDGHDRSVMSAGSRWYPLADLRRAARTVGRELLEAS